MFRVRILQLCVFVVSKSAEPSILPEPAVYCIDNDKPFRLRRTWRNTTSVSSIRRTCLVALQLMMTYTLMLGKAVVSERKKLCSQNDLRLRNAKSGLACLWPDRAAIGAKLTLC